jgi:YgiT-type zinc finger domain-containing protein
MRCVVCNSEDIQKKKLEEEIRQGDNVILVPIETLVCSSCGERYYDRKTMRYLEEITEKIRADKAELTQVGQVLRATT